MVIGTLGLHAQSVSYAQSLINQGRYLDAAKQLRPLADGGNAEAQYLAAKLFFEGKGVQKNEQQGIKYVTLSADQGYEYAIEYLVSHYGSEESSFDKAFLIAKKYTDKYPYLKKKNIGVILAKLYITGCGTAKNEALGWDLLEDNNDFSNVMENKKWATDYWDFKRRQAGYASMEDYADYLLSTESSSGVDLLNHLKMLHGSDFESYYETLAQEGNAFAMAIVAKKNYDNGYSSIASRWIEKATAAGSQYGKKLAEEINYVPTEYKNVNYTASIQNFGISRVRREYRYTIIDILYTNPGYYDWITISPEIFLSANGRKCKLVKSSEDLNRRITVTKQKAHTITLTFEAIPETCASFDMIAPGEKGLRWNNITLTNYTAPTTHATHSSSLTPSNSSNRLLMQNTVPNIKLINCFAKKEGTDVVIYIVFNSLANNNIISLHSAKYIDELNHIGKKHVSIRRNDYKPLRTGQQMIFTVKIKDIGWRKKLKNLTVSVSSDNKPGTIVIDNLTWE